MANGITKGQLESMIEFIRTNAQKLGDERVKKAYTKVAESAKLGYQNMADNEEKEAWLNYVLTDQAYRLGYYMWRHNIMTENDEKVLRTFMLPEDAIEIPRQYVEKDRAEDAELSKQHMEIENRRKGISIFQDILAGDDLETAKRKQKEFDERQAQITQKLDGQSQAPAML